MTGLRTIGLDEKAVKNVIDYLGIKITGETINDYIAFCPFHGNTKTPSFNIHKESGVWRCWNPTDGSSGNIVDLVTKILGCDRGFALRVIKGKLELTIPSEVLKLDFGDTEPDDEGVFLDESILAEFQPLNDKAKRYLEDRGISEAAADAFHLLWDGEAIVIPIRDIYNRLVAISKRRLNKSPKYKDSGRKSRTLFNISRATSYRDVIVVEGPLDAIKVYDAGFTNVVAVMGGNLSREQAALLRSKFEAVIIFTDSDVAGRSLARQVADVCDGLDVYFVPYLFEAKDPGEMTLDQIRRCITEKKTELEILLSDDAENNMIKALNTVKYNKNLTLKGGLGDMNAISGLKSLKKLRDDAGKTDSNFIKLKDGESITIRFLQELDESGKFYNEARGLAVAIFDHIVPNDFTRFICTLESQGKCVGCERAALNKAWRKRSRLLVNVWVEEQQAVKVLTTGFSNKGVGSMLIEYAEDLGTICDRNYKLRRSGEGLSTSYSLLPREPSPFDFDSVEVIDLSQFAQELPYEEVLSLVQSAESKSS